MKISKNLHELFPLIFTFNTSFVQFIPKILQCCNNGTLWFNIKRFHKSTTIKCFDYIKSDVKHKLREQSKFIGWLLQFNYVFSCFDIFSSNYWVHLTLQRGECLKMDYFSQTFKNFTISTNYFDATKQCFFQCLLWCYRRPSLFCNSLFSLFPYFLLKNGISVIDKVWKFWRVLSLC